MMCVCVCICVQLELLPLTDAVRETYIHMFMTSLRRRAMAVIHFVGAETYTFTMQHYTSAMACLSIGLSICLLQSRVQKNLQM